MNASTPPAAGFASLTDERRRTHGGWPRTAAVSRELKEVVERHYRATSMTAPQREALDMILAKIARILSGDPNHPDHWRDIAGYAELALGEGKR